MSENKVIDLEEYKYFNSPKFKSDELLEGALECISKNKALKLAKQALEIYPDNIDAENLIAEYEENPIKKLKKYDSIIEKATKLLEEQNMFDKENIGDFWLILETRPYMRARHNRLLILKDLGRYTETIEECEELLKLCNNDNMGIRYILIGLYCILEKFEECEKLYENLMMILLLCYFLWQLCILKKEIIIKQHIYRTNYRSMYVCELKNLLREYDFFDLIYGTTKTKNYIELFGK